MYSTTNFKPCDFYCMDFRGKALCVKLRVPCGDPRVTLERMQDLLKIKLLNKRPVKKI